MALGLINIKTVLELCLVINERSQRTVSCPATISELLFTQLTGYSSNVFSPLRNDLRLFETDSHTRLVHFHGSTRSSKFSQLLRKKIIAYAQNYIAIRRLLKANPDTTFRDEYPDN